MAAGQARRMAPQEVQVVLSRGALVAQPQAQPV